ncbi:acetyltransferase [Ensifer canadensis]
MSISHSGTTPIVVVGAGGHAKVVIDSIRLAGRFHVLGCLTNDVHATAPSGLPNLGTDDKIPELIAQGVNHFVCALGNNQLRIKIADLIKNYGGTLPVIVHPSAVVAESAILSDGTVVMAGAVVNSDARIGFASIVNTLAAIDHDCVVGPGVHIAPRVALAGWVQVGARSFLGIGTSVIPNIRIGADCIVAAGAVVVRDVSDKERVAGVPAKAMR